MRPAFYASVLCFAALLTGAQHSIAATDAMEEGQAAYDRGEYAIALRLWRPFAEDGVARAQNNLGVMYENGKGVRRDIDQALKWYRLAASQGYAGAQNNLAMMYAIGRVVPRNPVRAYMWFSLAAASLSGEVGETVTTSRDVFATAMTSQQIAAAMELVRRCLAANYKNCESDSEAAAAGAPREPASTPAVARTSHGVRIEDYPVQSLRAHESGTVTVTYSIDPSGSVTSCSVLISSGHMRIDQAACFMVMRRWKYTPATENGQAISVQYISKIVFPPR